MTEKQAAEVAAAAPEAAADGKTAAEAAAAGAPTDKKAAAEAGAPADKKAAASQDESGSAAAAAGSDDQEGEAPKKRKSAGRQRQQTRASQLLPRPDKREIIARFRRDEKDVGSSEVQISLITARIAHLTSHLKEHPKDRHTERGLMLLVNRRRKLLDYLSANRPDSYRSLIGQLNLRR